MNHDSNMSDSQYMRFQDKLQKKMEKYIDNLDNENRIKLMKRRFESSKYRKKTLWEKFKGFFGVMVFILVMCSSAVMAEEPASETLTPINNFRMVTSSWEKNVFTHGTDLSKFASKEVENIQIAFSKEYDGERSIVLMKAFFPVDIVENYVLMGDTCPEDELKVFNDGKEIFEFRNTLDIADGKFDVKMIISNRKHRSYSEVTFRNVKIVGITNRENK
jgi:hypothetical protein